MRLTFVVLCHLQKHFGAHGKSPLDFDLILFPIHVKKSHWVLGAIDTQEKVIQWYDSLRDKSDVADSSEFCNLIVAWLEDQHRLNSQTFAKAGKALHTHTVCTLSLSDSQTVFYPTIHQNGERVAFAFARSKPTASTAVYLSWPLHPA